MDTIAKFGTCIITLINTLFGIIGLAFLVGGCLVKWGSSTINDLLKGALSHVKDAVPKSIGSDLENFDLAEFIGGAATVFIIVGTILVAMVIWAYCGICCKSRWMLIVYAAILTAIILAEVAAVVIFTKYRHVFDDAIKPPMKKSLKLYYTGDTGKDATTLAWNAIMGLLKCCGVDGKGDFKGTNWNHTYTYSSQTIQVEAPILCCKTPSDSCSRQTTSSTNSYNEGCYDALWALVEDNKSVVIGIVAGLGAFQLILWFLVIWIIRALGKKKNKVGPT